jgi:hypothetical protein
MKIDNAANIGVSVGNTNLIAIINKQAKTGIEKR